MSDTTKIQRIDRLERMANSQRGHPRFRVYFTDGTDAPTNPNAGMAYNAENQGFLDTDLEVHYNGRGHITHWKRTDGQSA